MPFFNNSTDTLCPFKFGESYISNAVSNPFPRTSLILFGTSTTEDLKSLDEKTFLSLFEGVPQFEINESELSNGVLDILAEKTQVFNSKGEARRMIQSNAVSVNKEKIKENFKFSKSNLLNDKYILIQKGKKNYFIIIIS